MQILFGGSVEDALRQRRDFGDGFRARRPHYDIELRREWEQPSDVVCKTLREPDRGIARGFEHGGEFPSLDERKQALRRPQRDGGSAGTRTFQADFTEMKFGRSEIRVRRFVF